MYRVLIVDDEMPALRFVTSIIEQFAKNFQVAGTATSGEQGLNFLQQHAVDVLITDISMHGMNGIQLAQNARAMQPGIHIETKSFFSLSNRIRYFHLWRSKILETIANPSPVPFPARLSSPRSKGSQSRSGFP